MKGLDSFTAPLREQEKNTELSEGQRTALETYFRDNVPVAVTSVPNKEIEEYTVSLKKPEKPVLVSYIMEQVGMGVGAQTVLDAAYALIANPPQR
jgi:hypothetical protein